MICPNQESVVKLRVDSYESIQLTGLRHVNYWLSTYLFYDSANLKMS